MHRRPHQGGRDIGRVELQRRHSQHAGEHRHEGAHDRGKAGDEHAGDAVALDVGLAARDQLRIAIERPAAQNPRMVAHPEPERKAVTGDRAERRRHQQEPGIELRRRRQRADAEDGRGARHHGADHGDGFRQRQQEDRDQRKMRMRSDEIDQPLNLGRDRP